MHMRDYIYIAVAVVLAAGQTLEAPSSSEAYKNLHPRIQPHGNETHRAVASASKDATPANTSAKVGIGKSVAKLSESVPLAVRNAPSPAGLASAAAIGELFAGNASSFDYSECVHQLLGAPDDPICRLLLGYAIVILVATRRKVLESATFWIIRGRGLCRAASWVYRPIHF